MRTLAELECEVAELSDFIRWAWRWVPHLCRGSYLSRRHRSQCRLPALRGAVGYGLDMVRLRWRFQGLRKSMKRKARGVA